MESDIVQFNVISESKLQELFSRLESIENKLNDFANIVNQPHQEEEFLTRAQVVDLLKVTRQTLITWHKKGVLKAIRIGTRIRYRKSDILNFKS